MISYKRKGKPSSDQSSEHAQASVQEYVEQCGVEALGNDQADGVKTERRHGGEPSKDPYEEECLDGWVQFRTETGEEYHRQQQAAKEVHDEGAPGKIVVANVSMDEVTGDASEGAAQSDKGDDLDLFRNHDR